MPPALDGHSRFERFPDPAKLWLRCWNESVRVSDAFGGKTPPRFFYSNRPIPVRHNYIGHMSPELQRMEELHLWMDLPKWSRLVSLDGKNRT